jgi:hypothetical protein
MDRGAYDQYLLMFNQRHYDGVIGHFAEDCEISFAGYSIRGHQAICDFYAFFHDYVDDRITVTRFHGGAETVAIEAIVRLTGRQDLGAELLHAKGLGGLVPLQQGQVIEIPQFIHYHVQNGKFTRALCAIFTEPVTIIT